MHSVPVITTLGSAFAALDGIRSLRERNFSVKSLQDYSHKSSIIALLGADRRGIVASFNLDPRKRGNVLHADQHRSGKCFFQRVEWECALGRTRFRR